MLHEQAARPGPVLRSSDPAGKKPGRPHAQDLRSRVIAAVEEGASYRQVAARYGVSASAALKWTQRFRQTGSVAARAMGGDRRSRLKSERDWLLRRIAATPAITLAELHQELCARGIQVACVTIQRFLKKQDIKLVKRAGKIMPCPRCAPRCAAGGGKGALSGARRR